MEPPCKQEGSGPRKPGSAEEDCQAACKVGNSYVGFEDVNGSSEEGWGGGGEQEGFLGPTKAWDCGWVGCEGPELRGACWVQARKQPPLWAVSA